MAKKIMREGQPDGSVICTSCADPTRTETIAGPLNSPEQLAAIQAFAALEPDDGSPAE